MKNKKIKQKLSFASADIFGGGSFNIINFFYPAFLAITIGLSPFLISALMLIVRVWDAITDPLMGFISDKTNSKFGKRRVYFIFASPFILISFVLLFYPFNFSSVTLRFISVLFSYLLFTTVQTSVMIPYFSLSSEISSDYNERASFNSVRLSFSIFSSILCIALPGIIISSVGEQNGYKLMSLIFGIIFAVSVLITGLFTREEIVNEKNKESFSFVKMAEPLKLKPFRQYLVMLLMAQITMVVMAGLFFFYVDFYIIKDITLAGSSSMVGTIAAALIFLMQIFALPFYLMLINKKGKTFAYQVGSIIWILTALLILFIPANVNEIYLYLFAAAIGFGISGPGLVPHTMYGDVVDVGELMLKRRLDGQMSGFANFVNKIAQALGISIAMFILGLSGFLEQEINGPKINAQPESAQLAIKLIMVITPLVLLSIGILISKLYKVDKNLHIKVKSALNNEIDPIHVIEELR